MPAITEFSFCLRTSCLLHPLTNNQNKGRSVWVFLKLLHLMSFNLTHVVKTCYVVFPGSGKSEGSPVALQETSKPIQEESRELNKPGRPAVRCIPIALKYDLAILHFLSLCTVHYYLNLLCHFIFIKHLLEGTFSALWM